jgi:hypothetical protein
MERKKRKEIYTYEAPWEVYSLDWSERVDINNGFRLAVGSFVEAYTNCVEILMHDEATDSLVQTARFDHPYPTTKVMWMPGKNNAHADMIATTGDYLRLWNVHDGGTSVTMKSILNNNKKREYCAPLTSFDWYVYCPAVCVFMCVCVCVCMCVCMYVCMHQCIYVCIYVSMLLCTLSMYIFGIHHIQ